MNALVMLAAFMSGFAIASVIWCVKVEKVRDQYRELIKNYEELNRVRATHIAVQKEYIAKLEKRIRKEN